MSSPYPILDNRPIDKWKVTELKEELKRRKLTTKGLKEDLVKRLGEALRIERENAEVAEKEVEPFSGGGEKDVEKTPGAVEKAPVTVEKTPMAEEKIPMDADTNPLASGKTSVASETNPALDEKRRDASEAEVNLAQDYGDVKEKVDDVKLHVDINDPVANSGQGKVQESVRSGIDTAVVDKEPVVQAATTDSGIIITDTTVTEAPKSVNDLEVSVQQEGKDSNAQLDNEGSKAQLDVKDRNAQPTDVPHAMPTSNIQVSEVNPGLGFEVKSDSISTDSVSINENVELKDNIIADNVKLENSVKSEMVETSSRDTNPVGSHLMDVEEPLDKKKSSGERDDNSTLNADTTEKNDSVDVAYSEKLNLDRSSGDESIEEDALESKEIDSKHNSGELGTMSEGTKMTAVEEERPVDVVGSDVSVDKEKNHDKTQQEVISEKRKLDQSAGNNEPVKRQRRWNSESTKVPEVKDSGNAPMTAANDSPKSMPLKRSFSRTNSVASEDGHKERVAVPPSENAATNSLRIDNFLRPFTLKAVQELLGKTGTVTSFWMDHIKTHCYVTYSTVQEAIETRNSVYNLQWPPNGGRLLVAEFVDPQEVKARIEGAPTPTTPSGSGPTAPPSQPKSQPPRQQQLPPQPSAQPPPPALSNPPSARERLPPPPPLAEKQEPPIVTLDDLFRKTKATPRIYYLPLSEGEVAAKLAAQGRNAE